LYASECNKREEIIPYWKTVNSWDGKEHKNTFISVLVLTRHVSLLFPKREKDRQG
jgi:hypothetical protein